MVYSYRGKDYPKEIKLAHPEIETVFTKDSLDITRREFDSITDLDPDEITKEEENLILRELGRQFGRNAEQLKTDNAVNPFIIRNTLVSLMTSYDISSFDVVMEILRQSEDIINFNLTDYLGFTYIQPMLTNIFEYRPQMLVDFMLEEGVSVRGKQIVAEFLSRMLSQNECASEQLLDEIHKRLVGMFTTILKSYIADYPSGKICDKDVASHVVKAIVNLGLTELSGLLKAVYDKDMINKEICGNLDLNLSFMKEVGSVDMNFIETEVYPLMFIPIDLLWNKADNLDFGEEGIYKAHDLVSYDA